ncbi:hypothetical protein EDD11_001998 [Mortierella claussenii]|nr:hypothetical protein EDD11_001998 [Mortierella claussenii]
MEAKHRLIGGEMRFVAQLCTHLCSLTLRSCRVSPSSLDILCSGIPRVQFLVFDLCLGVTSASVASRLTRLPRLSHLEIMVHLQERGHGDWRENDMALLLTGCLSLESIKIVGSDLSHVHLLNVQRHESPLRLKYLYLISTFISENALKNLLSKCPSLSTLILLQNANKNATVQAIAETCPNLTMLELRNSKSIATFAFDAVFKGCPLLTHLDISYTLIFDAAVSALAQHCPELRVLDLTGCSRVTNASFREMMAALRHLRELKVGGCSKIKVEGFSGQEAWASRDSLEVLEMPFVGIRANVDVLHGLVAHLRSLTRLRRWTVDEEVGQHSLMQDVLKDRPEVVVSIAEPVEWRTSERHSLHCT